MPLPPGQTVQTVTVLDGLRVFLAPRALGRLDRTHGPRDRCPVCDEDLLRVGLPALAYTLEVCDCGSPSYSHLVEQLWHRHHLTERPTP